MGIIIRADREAGEFPLGVAVMLECDEPASMLCQGSGTFRSDDGFVGAHAEAMKAGWLERQSTRGRLWLCPECSGK